MSVDIELVLQKSIEPIVAHGGELQQPQIEEAFRRSQRVKRSDISDAYEGYVIEKGSHGG